MANYSELEEMSENFGTMTLLGTKDRGFTVFFIYFIFSIKQLSCRKTMLFLGISFLC